MIFIYMKVSFRQSRYLFYCPSKLPSAGQKYCPALSLSPEILMIKNNFVNLENLRNRMSGNQQLKIKEEQVRLMESYIDIHSHILPQLDDGAENFEICMKMLRIAKEKICIGRK